MTLKEFLSVNDRFAANAGCNIEEITDGYARVTMTVSREHLNAGGVCQGGAYFTLADLALAAVMNSRGNLTFGIQSSVMFLHSAKEGTHLVAEANEVYNHHKIPYIEVKITDDNNNLLCVVTGMAYRKESQLPVDGLM